MCLLPGWGDVSIPSSGIFSFLRIGKTNEAPVAEVESGGVSIPSSGIFSFLQGIPHEQQDKLCTLGFNPVQRDFFVSTRSCSLGHHLDWRRFQSRPAGFFRFYSRYVFASLEDAYPTWVSIPSSGIFSFLLGAGLGSGLGSGGLRAARVSIPSSGIFSFLLDFSWRGVITCVEERVSIPSSGIFSFLLCSWVLNRMVRRQRMFQSRPAGFFRFYDGTVEVPIPNKDLERVSIPSSGIFSFLHTAVSRISLLRYGLSFQSRPAGFFRFYPIMRSRYREGYASFNPVQRDFFVSTFLSWALEARKGEFVSIPSSGIFSFLRRKEM